MVMLILWRVGSDVPFLKNLILTLSVRLWIPTERNFYCEKLELLSQMEPSRDSHLFRSSHSGSNILEISDGKVLLWLKFSAGCSEQLFYTKMAPQKKTSWKSSESS